MQSDSQTVSSKTRLIRKTIVHILLIAAAGFIAYSNTFNVPFQFDDYDYIIDNHKLRDLNNLWPPAGSRWAGFLTFALNYKLHGLDVTGYHIVNLTIHIINALLVYWLVVFTFRTPWFSVIARSETTKQSPPSEIASSPNAGTRNDNGVLFQPSTFILQPSLIAFFSALLFVSHPVQTQAVTYIVQRFTSLATMFYLLSLVLHVKWRIQKSGVRSQNESVIARSSENQSNEAIPEHEIASPSVRKDINLKSILWYLAALASAVLAMKTKEIAFTLPIIITLYEFSFFTETFNLPKNRQAGFKLFTFNLKKFIILIPFLLTLIIIPLNFTGLEQETYEPGMDTEEKLRQLQLKDLAVLSKYAYLMTQFRVIVTYIRLLFLPINQNLDYDYPIYTSFINPNVFLSFLFLLSLFGLGVYLFHRSRITHHALRITAFGIFWFSITLSVESSIIPLKDVIFEHRFYLPSAGAFIAIITGIAFLLSKTFRDIKMQKAAASFFILILLIFLSAAYKRNTVWKSEISLWEDVIRKSPDKEGGYLNLGLAYLSQGLTDKAIKCFLFAAQLKPEGPDSYINLGLSYYAQGAFDKAVEYYQTALRLNPESPYAIHNNIGTAYDSMGLTDKAIEHYESALRLNPDFPEPYINLGIIYHSQGLPDKAIGHYQTALKLNPDSPEAHYNMGISYGLKGLTDSAIEHLESSLTLKPDFAKAHYYLGVEYRRKGLIDKAEEHFRTADKLGYKD